ncbi:MAG TPA: DUF309 domain-containing protein [Terriglobales bacterium]|nr:DUF309 domain-containing protein [Terriglobales bacterium]
MDSELYFRGIELFNRGEFFQAHEALEDAWRSAPASEKPFLQGLTQIAVAFVHHSRGNIEGAKSLLARGCKNLSAYSEVHEGINVRRLISSAEEWKSAFEADTPPPPFFKFTL